MIAPSAFRPDIERAIETRAATAHQSWGRHDIVCALCGVCFVIRNAPAELNRKKKQLNASCATLPNRRPAHFFRQSAFKRVWPKVADAYFFGAAARVPAEPAPGRGA
ncbi:TPA: hypothetical protein ACT5B8_001718 [Burkholderia cenocepacia]